MLSGTNRVNISFIRTQDRTIGIAVSVATVFLLLSLFALQRKVPEQSA
jgi:hypothetical protein